MVWLSRSSYSAVTYFSAFYFLLILAKSLPNGFTTTKRKYFVVTLQIIPSSEKRFGYSYSSHSAKGSGKGSYSYTLQAEQKWPTVKFMTQVLETKLQFIINYKHSAELGKSFSVLEISWCHNLFSVSVDASQKIFLYPF